MVSPFHPDQAPSTNRLKAILLPGSHSRPHPSRWHRQSARTSRRPGHTMLHRVDVGRRPRQARGRVENPKTRDPGGSKMGGGADGKGPVSPTQDPDDEGDDAEADFDDALPPEVEGEGEPPKPPPPYQFDA